MKPALIVSLAAAVACGGAARPDTGDPLETARAQQKHDVRRRGGPSEADRAAGADRKSGAGEADEMAAMPPAIAKFHATLAPYWHAKQGPKRMADTCGAIAEFHRGADDIVATPPPDASDPAAWTAGGKQLAEAVAALDGTCKANDAAAFEPAFAQVHERFHGVMAAAGGEHDHDHH